MNTFRQPICRSPFLDQRGWQLAVLVAVWIYLWALQIDNDGLWYRGDAARHALNGFFWSDYLRDFTLDAKGYALSYYARYPAIDPASRPPFFYLLEGAAFTLIGPSPYVAKGLVLCFALMAAMYLWAWLRRWVAEEAAWAAPLFLLLPGMSRWSHAIMLQVPAIALSMAALYHARCLAGGAANIDARLLAGDRAQPDGHPDLLSGGNRSLHHRRLGRHEPTLASPHRQEKE